MFALIAALALATADPLVDQGTKLYRDGDYLGAVRLLERVLGSGTSERTRARLYLAAAHFASGDRDAAQRVLSALLEEDPTAAPDTSFPPPFVQLFEHVRDTRKNAEPATPAVAPPAPQPVPIAEAPPPAPPRSFSRLPWIPLVAGVVGAGAGTWFLVRSQNAHAALTTPPKGVTDVLSPMEAQSRAADGATFQLAGWVTASVSAAVLVAALVWLLADHLGSP